jgi:hypothetical protein
MRKATALPCLARPILCTDLTLPTSFVMILIALTQTFISVVDRRVSAIHTVADRATSTNGTQNIFSVKVGNVKTLTMPSVVMQWQHAIVISARPHLS